MCSEVKITSDRCHLFLKTRLAEEAPDTVILLRKAYATDAHKIWAQAAGYKEVISCALKCARCTGARQGGLRAGPQRLLNSKS